MLSRLVEDLCLLTTLGVRIVIIAPNMEPSVSQDLSDNHRVMDKSKLMEQFSHGNLYLTRLHACFAQCIPRGRHKVRLISGNFVTARPVGVLNGIDHKFAGAIRSIDEQGIKEQLDLGGIVFLDRFGYSPSGQLYALRCDELSHAAAKMLNADKLILLGDTPYLRAENGKRISELSPQDIALLLPNQNQEIQNRLKLAEQVINSGIDRCHLIDSRKDGSLLAELLTIKGSGTLISKDSAESIRSAKISDLGPIARLLAPLENKGVLVKRPREQLEAELSRFLVVEHEKTIIGTGALHPINNEYAEIVALAIATENKDEGIGTRLLKELESNAKNSGYLKLIVLTTEASDWFAERGFYSININALPSNRQSLYNYKRNSFVFMKTIN